MSDELVCVRAAPGSARHLWADRLVAWVNILPRIPYLAVPGFLKTLILLTGKTGIFRKKLPKP